MRPIRIETNFRAHQLRQWHALTGAALILCITAISASILLIQDGVKDKQSIVTGQKSISDITRDVAALERAYNNIPNNEKFFAWAQKTLPTLDLPSSPSPVEVLYELEKHIPEHVYLDSFEYSNEGFVMFVAHTDKREQLKNMMSQLQSIKIFNKTQITSQREMTGNQFEMHVRVEL